MLYSSRASASRAVDDGYLPSEMICAASSSGMLGVTSFPQGYYWSKNAGTLSVPCNGRMVPIRSPAAPTTGGKAFPKMLLSQLLRRVILFCVFFRRSFFARSAPRIWGVSFYVGPTDKRLPAKLQSTESATTHEIRYGLSRHSAQAGSLRRTDPFVRVLIKKTY